jgi:hypothetical protein
MANTCPKAKSDHGFKKLKANISSFLFCICIATGCKPISGNTELASRTERASFKSIRAPQIPSLFFHWTSGVYDAGKKRINVKNPQEYFDAQVLKSKKVSALSISRGTPAEMGMVAFESPFLSSYLLSSNNDKGESQAKNDLAFLLVLQTQPGIEIADITQAGIEDSEDIINEALNSPTPALLYRLKRDGTSGNALLVRKKEVVKPLTLKDVVSLHEIKVQTFSEMEPLKIQSFESDVRIILISLLRQNLFFHTAAQIPEKLINNGDHKLNRLGMLYAVASDLYSEAPSLHAKLSSGASLSPDVQKCSQDMRSCSASLLGALETVADGNKALVMQWDAAVLESYVIEVKRSLEILKALNYLKSDFRFPENSLNKIPIEQAREEFYASTAQLLDDLMQTWGEQGNALQKASSMFEGVQELKAFLSSRHSR